MNRRSIILAVGAALLLAVPAGALSPGTDILVPAAARGTGVGSSTWVTDLCLFNPGATTVTGTVAWMIRDQANESPQTFSFTLLPGETQCLSDVILTKFGLPSSNGAFRVQATGAVVATSRIYNLQNGVTFGQGFEGILRSAAVTAGGSTDVVGLTNNASFRSNVVLMDGGSGSTVTLSLRSAAGADLGTRTYTLGVFEPKLFSVNDLDTGTFDVGTLHAAVTSGSALIVGSKVDNDPATGDPTTLAPTQPAGVGGSTDGTYQFAIYDSLNYASGGNIVVSGSDVVALNGTYTNWDKVNGSGQSVCTLIFGWGSGLPSSTTVSDLAQGMTFTESFTDSGEITWTVQGTFSGGSAFTGTVGAVGANFPSDPDPSLDQSGCNGTFPTLTMLGGKSN